ncbi:MAG: nucleotidyltransferase substrate binding protein [Burkholderiales bacterium]|jgi:nucleotidyltransferase substrate binding protein (TIGR01987 family)|nr:nucleotidyltransferase substrate binding protein [Burkholderiales bacterium]
MDAQARKRFEQQRGYFEQALARLGEVLPLDEGDIVRDALIKRFEFTFEMAWKALYRFLLGQGERVAAKAWDVLPLAFQSLLIDDADVWDRMRELRNRTSHEYDRAKAVEAAAFIRADAWPALCRLRDELARR